MSIKEQIKNYIVSLPAPKSAEMEVLHKSILQIQPKGKLWFLDGKDEKGKVVSNPNIGYGEYAIKYADGTSKAFYQIGISANKTGISVYVFGMKDKAYLATTFGEKIGKATVTGYCIKFKALKDIHLEVLEAIVRDGFETK